ncbi:hypothetical protein O1611_g7365 [Lasiodiplodia mahajangana]|uniref:Uncharacterized protein n=1 Tax=Lasiodiplodia mahajangana TaxID=1108764 RepID=A0ACC2JFN0_9PEZI|nr:hypothetical protein O1611_g7365 [Lasiodiplodia mahajangana]
MPSVTHREDGTDGPTPKVRGQNPKFHDIKERLDRILERRLRKGHCPMQVREAVKGVLQKYQEPTTRKLYQKLVSLTCEECKKVLQGSPVEIKGVVHGRVKQYDSLKDKLESMQLDQKFQDLVYQEKDVYKHVDMGDLAGVRIGLYFPKDVVTVAKAISQRFEVKHLFGTVTGNRRVTEEGKLNIDDHMKGKWNYTSTDGTIQYWEHYGYKSWQVVVGPGPTLSTRFEELKKEMERRGLGPLTVEIQIGTVVTQAWAEVQHNIVYKNPKKIVATPTMNRMIDCINGLAVTTDIMLAELERDVEPAWTEAEKEADRELKREEDRLKELSEDEATQTKSPPATPIKRSKETTPSQGSEEGRPTKRLKAATPTKDSDGESSPKGSKETPVKDMIKDGIGRLRKKGYRPSGREKVHTGQAKKRKR